MTNREASVIVGNIIIVHDECYSIAEYQQAKTMAISALEEQDKHRWILCNERLPEDRRCVLVTAYWHETYQVMMASYFGNGLWWCVPFNNCGEHMQKLNPKAWKPLPDPYKVDN